MPSSSSSERLPLQIVPPLLPPPTSSDQNPNPPLSLSQPLHQWQDAARSYLSSLPNARAPSLTDLDAWIDSNLPSLPEDLRSLPRPDLHHRLLSLIGPDPVPTSVQVVEHPYRFQRTDLWLPVYSWLEAVDRDQIVSGKEITDWLALNPEFRDKLFLRHSKYHLMHYIQKLHLKLLKKRGKVPKGMLLSTARASVKAPNSGSVKALDGGATVREDPVPRKSSADVLKDNNMFPCKKSEAFLRYELLTDLQNQLTSILLKNKNAINSIHSPSVPLLTQKSENNSCIQPTDANENDGSTKLISGGASNSVDAVSIHVTKQAKPLSSLNANSGMKRKRNPVMTLPAWSCSEALSDAGRQDISNGDTCLSSSHRSFSYKNIVMCLQGRERGNTWPLACSRGDYVGRKQEKWISFFEGWRSLQGQFEGPAVWLRRKSCSSWIPTYCAYTSSVAIAQPYGRHGAQKVLDVRFHPDGLPQLVCSSNEAPNELLLYNLLSGRAVQLSGHNCQIQAVEFAVRGASVVSCASNLLKVWDCTTGSCLYTLGSTGDDRASAGHTKKINAMTVNTWQSCLVVTSGGRGDGKLLLWNALRGELAADLNSNLRGEDHTHPSIEAMEFCSENLLACGSDCEYGGPAVVQLWDIDSPQSCQSFPANDSYITSLKINSDCNTLITGSGDGTIGLFDIRMCSAINYLSVGMGNEVTSVSFSSCGTYFNAASTSNNTLVWDTRLMPTNSRQLPVEKSCQSSDTYFMRPLHCLSHGKQMPTAEHAGQLPGHVDEGDQGVNDARWLHREPVLVTVSGDGSIAMWDVSLGQPCIRHLNCHTRCANTVAVAPNDEYLCTGGDDQKLVLYNNARGMAHIKWRLSHPLAVKD